MCFGSDSQEIVNKTELPPWQEDFAKYQIGAAQGQYDLAKDIYNQTAGYQPYPGQRIQPFTADQLTSMEMLRNQLGLGTGEPAAGQEALSAATARATQAGRTWADMGGEAFRPEEINATPFTAQSAQDYGDPYRRQVIDETVKEMRRQDDISRLGDQDKAAMAGAFGGARHGVIDSERERNFQDVLGRTVSGLLERGYESGREQYNTDEARRLGAETQNQTIGLDAFRANAGQFNQDQARMLDSSKAAMGLAGLEQGMGFADVNALMGMGNMGQNFGQAQLNLGYQDFLNQQADPYSKFGFLQGALQGQPFNPMAFATQTTQQPAPGFLQQAAGLGIAGLGALSGGPGLGANIASIFG